jgi:hypothetical protein
MKSNVSIATFCLTLIGLVVIGIGTAGASNFGTGEQITTISWAAFFPDGTGNSDGYASDASAGERWATDSTDSALYATIDSSMIPNGATIRSISFYVDDSSSSYDFTGTLYRGWCDSDDGDNCSSESVASVTDTGSSVTLIADTYTAYEIPVVYQYDDDDAGSTQEVYNYWLKADFGGASSSDVALRQVKITWQRNYFRYHNLTSPPEPFDDATAALVGSAPYDCITALWDAGIVVGCGGGDYCPGNDVTRLQLAVYVAGSLGMYWPADIPELPSF